MTDVSPLLRVAILNDHPIVVAGLAHVMAQHPSRIRVVDVDSQHPALDDVDIVLCDTFADATGGGMSLAELVARTDAKDVLFAGDLDQAATAAARRAGIAAYVSKRLSIGELLTTLEVIHRGDRVTPPSFDGSDVSGLGTWPGREHGLTSREAEVMALIALGHSNEEIARTIFLSINSIKTHIRTTYRKVGLSRRSQAVRWAIDHGFLADSSAHPSTPPAADPLDTTIG